MSDVITEMASAAESYLYGLDRFNGPMDSAMKAALRAAEEAGWRLVPVEPTEEMQENFSRLLDWCDEHGETPDARI